MSMHRAVRDMGASTPSAGPRLSAGPAVLFIAAVLVAGMTCILYLWQQSQIVAGRQDIVQLNQQLSGLTQHRDDLLAQEENLRSITTIVARAVQYGMVQSDASHDRLLALRPISPPVTVAQTTGDPGASVILPATNAAITSWWQGAWDGFYNLLQ